MIKSLQVDNLRSLAALNINFDATSNVGAPPPPFHLQSPLPFILFFGANAQGKTSILESLHLMLTGRSFKTAYLDQLIGPEKDVFLVRGSICLSHQGQPIEHMLGVQKKKKAKIQVAMDSAAVRSSMELTRMLPVQVVDHQSLQLILGEPGVRRRFVDWGVFHVEHGYGALLKKWQTALIQRNASLKSIKRNGGRAEEQQLRAWTDTYTSLSIEVTRMRERYFKDFSNFVQNRRSGGGRNEISADPEGFVIPGVANFNMKLKHGFGYNDECTDSENLESFKLELAGKRDYEVVLGRTYSGPQRADLLIAADLHLAKDVLSRGQCKLAAATLLLRQVQHLRSKNSEGHAVVLVDDLTAELDHERASYLLAELALSCSQLFVTALAGQEEELPRFLQSVRKDPGAAIFHVEHGQARRLIDLSCHKI